MYSFICIYIVFLPPLFQVLFSIVIGSLSLGNALPELETFSTALVAATAIFKVIDGVSYNVGWRRVWLDIDFCLLDLTQCREYRECSPFPPAYNTLMWSLECLIKVTSSLVAYTYM